jgi:chromate transporter
MTDEHLLWRIAITFASLSLVAVGGAPAVVPEMHRQVVTVLGWMDDATFANLFAVAQAAPGPNMLVSSLIGWHVSRLAGLGVATAGMILPPALLAFATGRILNHLGDVSWIGVAKEGLVPIAIGFFMAGGFVMARAADHNWMMAAITAGSTLFVFLTNKNPFWALAAGAALCMVRLWL